VETTSAHDKIAHEIEISSDIGRACEHCNQRVGGGWTDDGIIDESINHYIEQHGYKLLHVGTQTYTGDDGKPRHTTVAFVGTTQPPPPRPKGGKFEKFLEQPKGKSSKKQRT
jgi:hypothetical protein